DTSPPVISNVQTPIITDTTATITWTTDDLSDSTVNYGLTSALGSVESDPTSVTSHSVGLTGLSSDTTYYYTVTSCNADSYCSSSSPPDTFTTTTAGPDTTPPERSNGQPTGTLLSGTTETTISLTTDEAAACKYDTVAGTDYSLMSNTFSTTGTTSHSELITGLIDDNTYNYYVRCEDLATPPNINPDDFDEITFSVASGEAEPVWPGWDNINTIYYNPAEDDPDNLYLEQVATELETHLEQVPGKTLTITTDPRPASGSIYLEVDASDPELDSMGVEAFKLFSDDNGIYIIGKTHFAARHGAYELLDRLGFRWFFKHPAWYVTPSSLIELSALDEVKEPFYFYRYIGMGRPGDGRSLETTWNERNRVGQAGCYRYYPVWHSYSAFCDKDDPEVGYAVHPEYFFPTDRYPTYPWQLNLDNPDVLELAKQHARDVFDDPSSTKDVVPISPNDGGGWYEPWPEDDIQLITDKVFGFANEVAKTVAEEYPAGKGVSLYSYAYNSGIPSFDLESNLYVSIATEYNNGGLTMEQRINGFKTRGAVVGVRDYLDVWTRKEDLPSPRRSYLDAIQSFASLGAEWYTTEATDSWGAHGLAFYTAAKLLWEPTLNIDDIFQDFYTQAYGPAMVPMKRYYDRTAEDVSYDYMMNNFLDLAEAETLAVGNNEILERIRHIEYLQRFVWKWHYEGITNLPPTDLQEFFTFVTRLDTLYILMNPRVESDLRAELTSRGMTPSAIDALVDRTPPTAAEASIWLAEALAYFHEIIEPPPNILGVDMVPLDADPLSYPELTPLYGRQRTIMVFSAGNEDVTVRVKTTPGNGALRWFDVFGELDDTYTVVGGLPDWTPVVFHTTYPGYYYLHVVREGASPAKFWVDVPNFPAGMLAHPTNELFYPGETVSRNAPSYMGHNEQYFYVPPGTASFVFGCDYTSAVAGREAHGTLIDPDGNIALDFSTLGYAVNEPVEWTVDNPIAGVWKIDITVADSYSNFWLRDILPLVWHDAEYLLVQES
ncbi:DUF4838 domain-containing protein, partial [Chloroflexota bacterium]